MGIIGKIIRRPVSALVFVILLVLFGLFTSSRLSLDFFPDVESPEVIIVTNYADTSPEEIERTITEPLESAIKGLENVEGVSSVSREGSSVVTIEFKYGTGIDQNITNLKERVDRVRFPDDATDPTYFRFSADDIPILQVALVSSRDANDLRNYYDNVIETHLEQIDGVAQINASGGQKKKVYIEPSIEKLNAFDLTLGDIQNTIAANGSRSGLGTISTEVSDIGVFIDNEYEDLEELKNLVVTEQHNVYGGSSFVKIRDIASVRFGYDEDSMISLIDGRPSIALSFFKSSGSNIIDVADNIKNGMTELKSIIPKDFDFIVLDDQSEFIAANIQVVGQAMGFGALLAIIVLFFFLRNVTSVLVIMFSMPISIILTLMFMYFANMTLNFMTLSGLALGLGMLVDNSIVVLEHIYNKRLRGVKLISASEYGASEMSRSILASTLTTVLVFTPLILFRNELGTIGGFFSALVFTVVIAVISSYCVAAYFLPVLTSRYLPLYRSNPKGIIKKISDGIENFLQRLEARYGRVLTYFLHRRKRFIALILGVALLPLPLISTMGFAFAPAFAPEYLSIRFQFPASTKITTMFDTVRRFETLTKSVFDDVDVSSAQIIVEGGSGGGLFSKSNTGTYTVYYGDGMTNKKNDLISERLIAYRTLFPGVSIRVSGEQRGPGGGGSPFSLEIKSNDYDSLLGTVSRFTSLIEENIPDLINVDNNQSSVALGYVLNVDTDKAGTYGMNVAGITSELRTAIQGSTVGSFYEGSNDYDIRLRLSEADREKSDITEQLYINTSRGQRIPLVNVMTKNFDQEVSEIRRQDFQRTIIISADLASGYTAGQAVKDVRSLIEQSPLEEGVSYFFKGEFSDIQENFSVLGWVFILAVLFVYSIMAGQFESFLDPFIIVFTVPLTFAGVVAIYFIAGSDISSFTIVGVIMLVGIAVNHGIVLVDYINLLRKRGSSLIEAIVEGGRSRFQPILMTTFTTIFGLLPVALSTSNGAELVKPIALTVVGGLAASSFLSLFFIPLIYCVFHNRRIKVSSKKLAKREAKERFTAAHQLKEIYLDKDKTEESAQGQGMHESTTHDYEGDKL